MAEGWITAEISADDSGKDEAFFCGGTFMPDFLDHSGDC